MSRRNFFLVYLKVAQCFFFKNMVETKKAEPDLKLWLWGPGAPPHGGQDTKKKSGYLADLRPRPRKGSDKQFKFFV